MNRILLVIDDYSELVYLQTLLKKVGFDVDGIQNSRKFDEKRLTMNPELVIATAKGKNVNGLSLAEKMKRRGGKPKNILVIPAALSARLSGLQFKNVEATIESPVDPSQLLRQISDLMGLEEQVLIEKFERAQQNLDPDNDNDVHLMRRAQEAKKPADKEKSENEHDEIESYWETPEGQGEESKPSLQDAGEGASNADSAETLQYDFKRSSTLSPEERNERMRKMIDSLAAPEHDGFARDVVSKENTRMRQEEDEEKLKDLEDERQAFVRSMFNYKGKEDDPS